MTKPTNPNLAIPEGFALNGQKTDFSDDKIQSGFDPVDPDVLAGDNLNKFIDDAYKGLNYSIDGVSDLYKSNIVYDENETYNQSSIVFGTDENNKIVLYKSLADNNTSNPLTDTTKWQKVDLGADLDKINQSKALTTGAVSTDADVFADIQMYAHSTFDKSKFDVVGSPSITDDGIASGFSDGNYLKVDNITLGNDFEIDYVINLPTLINNNFILSGEDGNYIQLSVTSAGLLQTDLGNGTSWITNANHNTQIEANTDTALKIKYKNNTLNVYKNGNLIDSTEVTGLNIPACNLLIGTNRAKAIFTNGSIFLKSFKAKANGVVIFTGNQTGLDIIKPDDYTVVGTPTITADGVASGFSDGNYLKMPNLPIIENNITMTCNVNIGVIGTVAFNYIMGWYPNENSSYLRFVYQNGKINIQWKDKDLTSGQAESNNVDSNSEHLLKFELTESNLKCYLDNVLFANVDVEINLDALTPDVFTIGRMNNVGTWILNQGSIDLNSFKVYVDGSLVYQPCLKIPYTLSKTGSKIVDAAYRDRVKDVYEQYGTAMYYTIDEENQNFTLPMGEIYGMINQGETFASKEFAKNAGFPSGKYQDLTLTNGAQYTAPANGMFFVQATITIPHGGIYLVNQTKGYAAPLSRIGTQPPLLASTSLMVEKGDVMLIDIDDFNTGGNSNRCRFYYAEGDKE